MAYVVARPKGRFEIRESVHTPKGPRARSLANFAECTDEVLERARRRASRPFDTDSVRAAALRLTETSDAPSVRSATEVAATVPRHERPETRHFVEASRRMAKSLERVPEKADRRDPGEALISLLDFVAHVSVTPPSGPPKPLRFPPLGRLREARRTDSTREIVSER